MNDSRYNTGRRVLPPVEQPEVYYSYDESALFPELETGGIGPMAGPAYDYSPRSRSRVKWPRAFEGKPLFYEWTRDYIKAFSLTHGQVTSIEDVAPDIVVDNPMDMEFGPDGALYILEYGDGFFSENPEAQLARIDWTRGNRTPVPVVAADVDSRPVAADRAVQQRGNGGPRRRRPAVRVGLRRRRPGRLPGAEPVLHVHRGRRLRGDADRHRLHRPAGLRHRCRSSSATRSRW